MAAIRKLTDIIPIAKRPTCAYCGKRLRPWTSFVETGSEIEAPPPAELVQGHEHYSPERVYRMTNPYHGDRRWWHYWRGNFDAYRQLFCTQSCGVEFGAAAYNGGFRYEP